MAAHGGMLGPGVPGGSSLALPVWGRATPVCLCRGRQEGAGGEKWDGSALSLPPGLCWRTGERNAPAAVVAVHGQVPRGLDPSVDPSGEDGGSCTRHSQRCSSEPGSAGQGEEQVQGLCPLPRPGSLRVL